MSDTGQGEGRYQCRHCEKRYDEPVRVGFRAQEDGMRAGRQGPSAQTPDWRCPHCNKSAAPPTANDTGP